MKSSHFLRIIMSSAAVFLVSNVIADEPPATLARFADGDGSFQELIEFPDSADDILVVVYCTARILPGGGIRRNYCFSSDSDDQPFRDAISTAIKTAKVIPAIVDGDARSVDLIYRVAFMQKDGIATVGVYSNWGDDDDSYGLRYRAPQRYTDEKFPPNCMYEKGNISVLIRVVVDVDSKLASEVEFDPDKWQRHGQCITTLRHLFERAKYIPGQHDGRPVKATFVEPFGAFERMKLH